MKNTTGFPLPGEKAGKNRMNVGLPKQFDKRLGSETTKMQQVVVDSSRQKELGRALPEFAVLSEAGYETKACAQGCWSSNKNAGWSRTSG